MTVSKTFKDGDRVISVRDTSDVPEGFIGTLEVSDGVFDYMVTDDKGKTELFNADELELLSVSKSVRLEGVVHPVEIKGTLEPEYKSALDKQVSGNHYKDCGIQPIEYIHANNLSYFQGNVVKYVTRYKDKAGKADLEKAIHYLELMIELEYPDAT